MTRIRTLVASGVAFAFLSASATFAQETPEAPGVTPDLSASEDPCEVVPGDQNAPTTSTQNSDEAGSDESGRSLSDTLDRCGGVLSPPAVGDHELVEPAPDKGVTPIIPPSAVPGAE